MVQEAKVPKRQNLTDVGNKELTEMGQTKTAPFFLWSSERESEEYLYRKDDSNAVIYL